METLQILGWIYLGLSIGVVTGVFILGLFQAGRVTSLEREIFDLKEEKRLLKNQLNKSYKKGKPQPRKKRTWNRKPVKK